MNSPENDLKSLTECIMLVINAEQPSKAQIWELANYYELAKLYYSKADTTTALALLQRLRTIPETDMGLALIRARAEGYSDAIQAASNSAKWAGTTQMQVATPVSPIGQPNIERPNDITNVTTPYPENIPQKAETKVRVRPPLNDV